MQHTHTAPASPTESEVREVFLQFHKKFITCLRKEAETMQFSMSQLEILKLLIDKESLTMKDIAAHLRITAPSATSLITHLYEKKLVGRKADPNDRRGVRIFPTKKTLTLFSKLSELKADIFTEILKPLTKDDKSHLITILKKLL